MKTWKGYLAKGFCKVQKKINQVTQRPFGFRVLMYHAVGTKVPGDYLERYSITPDLFYQQMKFLSENFPIRKFTDVLDEEKGTSVTFDDGFADNLYIAAPILVKLKIPFTIFVTSNNIGKNSKYLTPYELRDLSKVTGATIGSHGATHRSLTGCNKSVLQDELSDSRKIIEDITGKSVKIMSYPHGSVNQEVRNAVYSSGYEFSAGSRFGNNLKDFDPLNIDRTDIWSSDNLGIFNSKLNGDWDWLRWR